MIRFILLFLYSSLTFARGLETFDHLQKYKTGKPQTKGPSSEKVFIKNKLIASALYNYNNHNQLIKADYFENGKFQGNTTFYYKNNKLFLEKTRNINNIIIENIDYQYNKFQIIKYTVRTNKRTSPISWEFKYHKKKLSMGIRRIRNEITEKFSTFCEKNRCIQKIMSNKNKILGTITSEKDKTSGKIIRRIRQDNSGKKRIDYFYNNSGNIIKMTFYEMIEKNWKEKKRHELSYL